MAYNIQIAFATTVVGCVVAGVELLIGSVRKTLGARRRSPTSATCSNGAEVAGKMRLPQPF